MRIKATIFFSSEKKFKIFNPEQLLVFKALQVSPQMHQSNTSHACTIHGCNLEKLLVLRLYELVDECTSPLVEHLPYMANLCMPLSTNSLFLELKELVDKCTSPPV